ncbi:ABC transporter permease [Streptacidiphilus jiangxiensis]|uniref:Transport permease protein n=1 Tax=Streptacidiphilus jiangxiensis TaxID=235985 RepID=A0A1H7KSC1_STRJI|nr:ABC transporter permease [Streptacidiphilus jiangxiensis]SEK89416.1 ABC-2 type transport system permease protein [Streptacidiphilus jiangxiensis]
MTWLTYAAAQFRLSQQVYWKRIGIALTGTALPLGLGAFLPLQARHTVISRMPGSLYVLTGLMAFALFFTVYNLVNAVTSRRDALIYKRLRASALPDSSIFAGEALAAAIPSCVVASLLMVYGAVFLGSGAPHDIALLVLGILLGSAMFTMLAIGVSGVLPGADTAMWIVTPAMVVSMFCSGVYSPVSQLPAFLRLVAPYLPMTPVVRVVRTAYLGQESLPTDLGDLGVMLAWTVIGFALARRLFRWDPRRTS